MNLAAAATTGSPTPTAPAPEAQGADPARPGLLAALPCPLSTCSHSISRRLSRKLALFTVLVLGALFATTWFSISMLLQERNAQDMHKRTQLIADTLAQEARAGGEAAVTLRLRAGERMRHQNRLQVWAADGRLLHGDAPLPAGVDTDHVRSTTFDIPVNAVAGAPGTATTLRAQYTVDYADDAAMGRRWAWILVTLTLTAGCIVALGVRWHVSRQLQPLHELAAQTRAISAQRLSRLTLADPAEELLPWIDQFNALMQRLEQSYAQLEGFNADVAHELRTPLANLMGQTEVVLARARSPEELRDTLASNLEEMQRLSGMVNDMLFLSQADRGAVARRGQPVSLAALVHQVVEFHEGPLEDAGLALRVQGDATLAVDDALFKRALSNLLGNATRFASRGSTVVVGIEQEAGNQVRVEVRNQGVPIDAQALPRLFDRFFRAEESRSCDNQQHHGLGLAIVAAIARMHDGRTVAESAGGTTRVGFTLAVA
jgi:two-component system heavy metal sensor histidine kinase CusS